MGWQPAAQLFVIKIRVQVRQDGAARLDASYPFQRIVDAKMARVRAVAQGVQHPDIHALQSRGACSGQPAEVAGISKPAKPKAERDDAAMRLQQGQSGERPPLPH